MFALYIFQTSFTADPLKTGMFSIFVKSVLVTIVTINLSLTYELYFDILQHDSFYYQQDYFMKFTDV